MTLATADGFAPRPSGLLVPSETLDKQRFRMPQEDFKVLRRAILMANDYGMRAPYYCQTCQQQVSLSRTDQIVTPDTQRDAGETPIDSRGGRIVLTCGCASWEVR